MVKGIRIGLAEILVSRGVYESIDQALDEVYNLEKNHNQRPAN